MDGPGRLGHHEVDVFVWVPLGEEREAESESTSSGECLSTGNSAFFELLAILAVTQLKALFNV